MKTWSYLTQKKVFPHSRLDKDFKRELTFSCIRWPFVTGYMFNKSSFLLEGRTAIVEQQSQAGESPMRPCGLKRAQRYTPLSCAQQWRTSFRHNSTISPYHSAQNTSLRPTWLHVFFLHNLKKSPELLRVGFDLILLSPFRPWSDSAHTFPKSVRAEIKRKESHNNMLHIRSISFSISSVSLSEKVISHEGCVPLLLATAKIGERGINYQIYYRKIWPICAK